MKRYHVITNNSPHVRIGMIQGSDCVHFEVMGRHRIAGDRGHVLGEADEGSYEARVAEVKPGKIEYWLRAGIVDSHEGEQLASKLRGSGLDVRVETVGSARQFARHSIDNREDWVLIGPFASQEEADDYRHVQQTPGELTLVEWVTRRPEGLIELNGLWRAGSFRIEPAESDEPHLWLDDVLIGIEFHWQHREKENLRGALEICFNREGELLAVNELPIESYLASLNSSEMTGDSPEELLKAQTVAARSTIFATMGKHHFNEPFDLCADDHCQCYYGAAREEPRSWAAVRATWGEVLLSREAVCDARYAKICGGIIEDYRYVWEDREIPYLLSGVDGKTQLEYPAKTEEAARRLIDSSPDVFCNIDRYSLPASLEERCRGLFRWVVRYGRAELEELIQKKTGVEFGDLLDLVPLERGDSGRIVYLEVVGSKHRFRLGKELEIRRALSDSHLYSSCFYVEKESGSDGKPRTFTLKGAGWGHGVGLCQVGATVMAQKGYDYREILFHYYKNSTLEQLYAVP